MKTRPQYQAPFRYLIFIAVTLFGCYIRYLGRDFISGDFANCLYTWYLEMTEAGPGIESLQANTVDYPIPYAFLVWLLAKLPFSFLYSLKTLHGIFDVILAVIAGKIVQHYRPGSPDSFYWGYCITFLIPNIFINSCYWGQCDGLYSTFMLAAVLCWLKEKYPLMMIMAGIALSYKLQAIFILPFLLIIYWLQRKFSIFQFLLIPATIFIMNIPALFAGYSPSIILTKYLGLTGGYPWLYYFYPNLWLFFQGRPYYFFSSGAILLTLSVLLVFVVLLIKKNITLSRENVLPILLWTVYTCVFFLPSMHERYGFFAELIAVIIAIINRRSLWLPLTLMLGTLPKYLYALNLMGNSIELQMATAICNICVYFIFTVLFWRWLFNGKPELCPTQE